MDKYIKVFLKVLDSSDNTTGGGSASSISGAMAAGLAGMVARLSIGKKDLEPDEHYKAIATEAETLCQELFAGSSEDSEAFAVVSNAFSLPKATDEEKAVRTQTIKEGMTLCAEVPLHNTELCSRVLSLCNRLEKSYNTATSSDLECAKNLAVAGIKGCGANVRVNLPYLKDQEQVSDLETRLEQILINSEIKQ